MRLQRTMWKKRFMNKREAISGDIQFKILNNVRCVHCKKESSIGNLSGKVQSGMLVLRGICTKCDGDVARVIENE